MNAGIQWVHGVTGNIGFMAADTIYRSSDGGKNWVPDSANWQNWGAPNARNPVIGNSIFLSLDSPSDPNTVHFLRFFSLGSTFWNSGWEQTELDARFEH